VAQPGGATVWQAVGRRFKSGRLHPPTGIGGILAPGCPRGRKDLTVNQEALPVGGSNPSPGTALHRPASSGCTRRGPDHRSGPLRIPVAHPAERRCLEGWDLAVVGGLRRLNRKQVVSRRPAGYVPGPSG
jgi:hypothetical protein